MFLCYIDESGTPDLPGNTSHYVLSGISMPSTNWKQCDSEINSLKLKYKISNAEIHTAWMFRPYLEQRVINNFDALDYNQRRIAVDRYRKSELLRLQRSNHKLYRQVKKNYRKTDYYTHLTYDERKNLLRELSEIIGGWDFVRLFAECIDKIYFDPNVGGNSVSEQAFEQLVSRFEQYLKITSSIFKKNMGMLIHDNNPTVAKRLSSLMIDFHRKGTLWTSVTNIIETPLFVDSKLTCMVQVADFCSFVLRRYLEKGEDELLSNIYKRADRKDGKVVGIRHFTVKSCNCEICISRSE